MHSEKYSISLVLAALSTYTFTRLIERHFISIFESLLGMPDNRIVLDNSKPTSVIESKEDRKYKLINSTLIAQLGLIFAQLVRIYISNTRLRGYLIERIFILVSSRIILYNKNRLLSSEQSLPLRIIRCLSSFCGFDPKTSNVPNYLYLLISKNLFNLFINTIGKSPTLQIDISQEEEPMSFLFNSLFSDGEVRSAFRLSCFEDIFDALLDYCASKLFPYRENEKENKHSPTTSPTTSPTITIHTTSAAASGPTTTTHPIATPISTAINVTIATDATTDRANDVANAVGNAVANAVVSVLGPSPTSDKNEQAKKPKPPLLKVVSHGSRGATEEQGRK